MNNFKILISFEYVHEAHIVRGYLESNDITVFLQDELTIQENHLYSNAIGGVKLKVHESQYEEAKKLLVEGEYIANDGEDLIRNVTIYKAYKSDRKNCPYCNSENFKKNIKANWLTVLGYFILGSFLPVYRATYVCFDCRNEWKWKKP